MKRIRVWPLRSTAAPLCAVLIAGCGGGGSSTPPPAPPPPPAQYTIGGTVSALVGTGLVLEDNGGDDLSVSANGSFTFKTSVTSGGAYSVTVGTQPSSPAQTCEVTNAMGTATADVTNVTVDCGHNEWTWVGGSMAANQAGTYGTMGTSAAANIPGGRSWAVSWVDTSGTFWLFSGYGYDSAGTFDSLNDLWKYNNGEWTWAGGSDLVDQPATYGTMGSPSPGNIPGARNAAATWTDLSGKVWLFGGDNVSTTGVGGRFNDLWMYSAGEWTWMAGSNALNQSGVYGTLGTPSANNIPGGRDVYGASWVDSSGNLWLFGGYGYDSAGTIGWLNDLWKYSSGEWTWMGGPDVANQKGSYGALGSPSATNIPGARAGKVTWTDSSGDVWLFGGGGYDSAGTNGYLNDLWKYSNGQWTWMGGSNLANQKGVYGTQGVASASNIPGGREGAIRWTDASGDVWLFGGAGYDAAGNFGYLSDLWKYSNGEWNWMSGPDTANQIGTYGTMGTPNPANTPGGRQYLVTWVDAQGNLWLFGGHGYGSNGTVGYLNDLWKYEP
jgi:N-acetylneuraminic acid mutarotase